MFCSIYCEIVFFENGLNALKHYLLFVIFGSYKSLPMRCTTVALALLIFPFLGFSQQQFKRKKFDYKIPDHNFIHCNDSLAVLTDNAMIAIEQRQSFKAVDLSKTLYNQNKSCPEIFDTYGYSLFRNGQWMEGIAIIEEGIEKFGPEPGLVKRRSGMSIEMAQLGFGSKQIDGNAVYKAAAQTQYTEEQFIEENFRSALADLEYLNRQFHKTDDKFILAKIYQALGDYTQSDPLFESLLETDSYEMAALFNLAENNIRQKKYDQAEKRLLTVLNKMPNEPEVYDKLSELYGLTGNTAKKRELERKGNFHKYVPASTDLIYTDENYELILFFGTPNHTAKEKLDKLKQIYSTKDQTYTTDICLVILKIHANHGNGLEEEATSILAKIGKPALSKVHDMFKTNVSTCTITNLADIMATVKDESSWTVLTDYLPIIAQMPATLIPPGVPEKIIKFDADRGTREVLKVIKPMLTESQASDDPLNIPGFTSYVYYLPLKDINNKKLLKIAHELNYSDIEVAKLQEKLKE